MAKRDKTKEQAEELFVVEGMTAKEISELAGVSEVTLSRWRNAGNWDSRRENLLTSPLALRETLLQEAKRLANGEKAVIDADSLSKVISAVDKLEKKISARVVANVIKELDNWFSRIEPQKASEMLKYHKAFITYKIQQESGE